MRCPGYWERSLGRADLWLALLDRLLPRDPRASPRPPTPPSPAPTRPRARARNTPDDSRFDECEADDADGAAGVRELLRGAVRGVRLPPRLRRRAAPGRRTRLRPATRPRALPAARCAGPRRRTRPPGDLECAQIAGVRADTAWKYSTRATPTRRSRSSTPGSRWQDRELSNKVALNRDELPVPSGPGEPARGRRDCARSPATDDADDNGAFNVLDYRCDSRVGDRRRATSEADGAARRLRPDRRVLRRRRRRRRRRQRLRRRHRRLGLLRRRQRPLRRLELLLGQRPRHRPRQGGRPPRRTTATRRRRDVPRVPDHAAAGLGHLRRPDRQLRDGVAVRGRQRRERRRGRGRRARQHAVRPRASSSTPTSRAWR